MDHVVYVDTKAEALEKLLNGSKSMIIRGATGRKLPYGLVKPKDILFFIQNNGEGFVKAKAMVSNVFNSEKMSKEESAALVNENQTKLNLSAKQIKKWAGKRYLVLVEVENIEKITPQYIDKSNYGNMDDWLPVENIEKVIIEKQE